MNKDRLRSKQITSPFISIVIGLLLGMLGTFLGIGGGPFNVAALCFFFSMPTKRATQNSLFIVLLSQAASTLKIIFFDGLPDFSPMILAGMVLFGVIGSEIGRRVNKRIDNRQATVCLEGSMILILCINIYNILKFFG